VGRIVEPSVEPALFGEKGARRVGRGQLTHRLSLALRPARRVGAVRFDERAKALETGVLRVVMLHDPPPCPSICPSFSLRERRARARSDSSASTFTSSTAAASMLVSPW